MREWLRIDLVAKGPGKDELTLIFPTPMAPGKTVELIINLKARSKNRVTIPEGTGLCHHSDEHPISLDYHHGYLAVYVIHKNAYAAWVKLPVSPRKFDNCVWVPLEHLTQNLPKGHSER